MHTKAVYHAARALCDLGLPVLRFNFRGVGASAGRHTGGSGERDDARVALEFVAARHPGEPLFAGGFSFGSWIACAVGQDHAAVRALVALGPPLDLYDFGFVRGDRPILCLAGDRDEFVRPDQLRDWAARLGDAAHVVVVPGAAHLLTTHLAVVEREVRRFASAVLPAA
jgi:alpha/beta superfamily hydrolase